MKLSRQAALGLIGCLSTVLLAQEAKINPTSLLSKDDAYLTSEAGKKQIANVLSFQNPDGGFPKNYLAANPRPTTRPAGRLPVEQFGEWEGISTIDNNATYTEIRLMARAYGLNKDATYRDSAIKGIEFLIANQYPNGGWAQRFPPPANSYHKHITYNDNAMTGVMYLMKDAAAGAEHLDFISPDLRAKAAKSFDEGIDCILKTQIKVNGKLTAWCQQHDYLTLEPVKARAFEPACICSSESVGLIRLLMSIDKPSAEIKESIRAAVVWLDEVKITGKKLDRFTAANGSPDMRLLDDSAAPPIWSRMYDIQTNKPIFGGINGTVSYNWEEITQERRVGYAWYRPFAANMQKEYEAWQKKIGN